jgi:2,3-bisphosphoglycerate-dependent phosphoglycerate mutase
MTRVLLIRHGQSANNALPEHQRVADPPLTEIGVRQAAATARYLQDQPVTHLYCSPFLRALETVRPVADSKGMSVQVRSDLFEQGGCYSGYLQVGRRGEPGMGRQQLQSRYPGWSIDPQIDNAGWWGRDYETWEQARTRAKLVAAWIDDEIASQPGLHVMVIHADFKALLVEAVLARGNQRLELCESLRNTGITEIGWSQPSWKVHRLNCVRHLDASLVTS